MQTVLVATLALLLPPAWALMTVAWIGVLAYVLALTYLADVHKLQWWATALLLIVGVLAGLTTFQLLNGLETGLAMAALTLALALATSAWPSRLLCVVCGIMPFLRPELVVISVLLIARQLVLRWRCGEKGGVAIDVICSLGSGAVWALVLLANTGHFYPDTINAKRYFFAEALLPVPYKVAFVSGALWSFGLAVGALLVMCLVFAAFSATGRLALVFGGIFLASYFVQFPGGLWHNGHRYLYLLLTIMLLGVATGLSSPHRNFRVAATIMLAISAIQAVALLPSNWSSYQRGIRITNIEMASLASFCNEHIPPSSRVLVHDAGYLSNATTFPLIDLVGLKTPSSIAFHQQLTYPTLGRARPIAISEIAEHAHAEYLIVIGDWETRFHIAGGLLLLGWQVEQLRPTPPENGLDHYLVFHIQRTP